MLKMVRLWRWPAVIAAIYAALSILHAFDVITYAHTTTLTTTIVTAIAVVVTFEMREHLVKEQQYKNSIGVPAILKALRDTKILMTHFEKRLDSDTMPISIQLYSLNILQRLYFIQGEMARYSHRQEASAALDRAIYAMHVIMLMPESTENVGRAMTKPIRHVSAMVDKAIAESS